MPKMIQSEITPRQQEVVTVFNRLQKAHKRPPTAREIALSLKLTTGYVRTVLMQVRRAKLIPPGQKGRSSSWTQKGGK